MLVVMVNTPLLSPGCGAASLLLHSGEGHWWPEVASAAAQGCG